MTSNGLERGIRKNGFKGAIRRGIPMSEITSFRIGGPADLVLYPRDLEELNIVRALCRDQGFSYLLLGNGTNLLVADKGVREPLINLSHGFKEIKKQGHKVMAGAGAGLPQLLNFCTANALGGLEPLAGIPGTVGGGIRMNAGSWGAEIGAMISSLLVMDGAGETRWVKRSQVAFGYRGIDLPAEDIILQGEFALHKGKRDEIKNRMEEFLRKKKETQPLFQPSAGSIFKNPPAIPAGRLIEEAGLKGTRRGDAMISPLHANFIVNMGAARARDVLGLIELIRQRIYKEKRIKLELEVLIIGEQALA
ncbi:MAG: UDP-N-acetylenolpyruvoylglucosamine reductase [Deltaproteobacteria bacterium RBG_16_54_11]|jgi:UDP-N-acetylmuramate dehydrogenase|nr:MAG: UDP-N-acetylenolpyruvoylglucosamine reductase [Deltaproteobacteria bacterium RBG_16_54_11]